MRQKDTSLVRSSTDSSMNIVTPTASTRAKHLASVAMQALVGVILVVGLCTRNVGVTVNAALALAVTFLPAILRRDFSIRLGPGVTLWLTTAVLLHAVGMVGLYDTVWWWDHLTHTLSATIVAATGYITTRALDEHSEAVQFTPEFTFVYVLLFTVAFGVLWEVAEFAARGVGRTLGMDPVLVQYGLHDTMLDLVFDVVGAVLVASFGTDRLSTLVKALEVRLASADSVDRK